jgi:protocatechuate 3,4-dioxygenase beta subunit
MSSIDRRRLLATVGGAGALVALTARAAVGAGALLPTPAQATGPFYPPTLPLDADADLVQVAGQAQRASGTILHLGGRILDANGRAVGGARVEIWQCDAFGVYHHPGDRRGPAEPQFQGFGHALADAEGGYRFRTIVPVAYPGRTPHIHFRVVVPGGHPLTTQMYFAGEPLNDGDFLYRRLGERRADVTVLLVPAPELEPSAKTGAKRAGFDIVLGPDGTPSDS